MMRLWAGIHDHVLHCHLSTHGLVDWNVDGKELHYYGMWMGRNCTIECKLAGDVDGANDGDDGDGNDDA
jgi:hypothetical protein